jgi:hypothetical protein
MTEEEQNEIRRKLICGALLAWLRFAAGDREVTRGMMRDSNP